jgi:hypothetical protein
MTTKVKLIPSKDITVEFTHESGPQKGEVARIQGVFKVESKWEGFTKLKCSSPVMSLIVYTPQKPDNPWDFFGKIFAANDEDKMEFDGVEVIVVATDITELKILSVASHTAGMKLDRNTPTKP